MEQIKFVGNVGQVGNVIYKSEINRFTFKYIHTTFIVFSVNKLYLFIDTFVSD